MRKIRGPTFSKEINSNHYILTPFLRKLTDKEYIYSHFMHSNATVHAANYSRTALQKVFGELFTSCTLWQTIEYRVCANNPHYLQELQATIQRETAYISRWQLYHVSRNIFIRCKPYLKAGGWHFEILPWNKVSWTAAENLTLNSWWMQAFFVIMLLWLLLHSGIQ